MQISVQQAVASHETLLHTAQAFIFSLASSAGVSCGTCEFWRPCCELLFSHPALARDICTVPSTSSKEHARSEIAIEYILSLRFLKSRRQLLPPHPSTTHPPGDRQ